MISATPLVRRRGPFDAMLVEVDRALQVLSRSAVAGRAYPARAAETAETLTEAEKRHAAGLMRVNHVAKSARRRCTGDRPRPAAMTPPGRCCATRPPKRWITWPGAMSA